MNNERIQKYRDAMVKCLVITFNTASPVSSGEILNFDPPINYADQGIVESTVLLADDLYLVTCRGRRAAKVEAMK